MKKPPVTSSERKTSIIRIDRSKRTHFVTPKNFGTAVQRFEYFQDLVLNGSISPTDSAGSVLACLIAFESIALEADLRSAFDACKQAARWNGPARIEWLDGKRTDARNLSCITVLAVAKVSKWPTFEEAKTELTQMISQNQYDEFSAIHATTAWDLLLKDALAWALSTVSPVFYGHISGTARLSALPGTTLVREVTKRALQAELVEVSHDDNVTAKSYIRAYEAAMLGKPPSVMQSGKFITKLTSALIPPLRESISKQREHILKELHILAAELDEVDEVCALLYIFALHMMVNGTLRLDKAAPGTPYSYIKSFAASLHLELNGLQIFGMDSKQYTNIFKALLGDATSMTSHKATGLKSFHLFLRANWNVPPLPASIFKIDIEAVVAANVIWPHELETVTCWIEAAESDRFNQQLQTALAIAGHTMVRISELLVLRVMNLIDEGEFFSIEIARNIIDGKEKSTEGRRRIEVKDPKSVLLIREWLNRRIEEVASPNDYLFGDPSNPLKVANAGKMYFLMNKLLKTVSGDTTVSVHTLRHTFATYKFLTIQKDNNEYEVNPLDVLGNQAGHVGGHVTAVNYCHLFEEGIRCQVDSQVRKLAITYPAASMWSSVAQSTLRQRVRRQKVSGQSKAVTLWEAIDENAAKVSLKDVSTAVPTVVPQSPLESRNQKALTYQQVAAVLAGLANGLATSQCSLSQDLAEEVVIQAVQVVGGFAERHGKPELELSDSLTLGMKSLQDPSGDLLGVAPDFSRMSQPRWALLTQAITKCDKLLLSDAVQYWTQALRDRHLSVRPGPGFDQFIALLSKAGINSSLIAMKWAAVDNSDKVFDSLSLAQESFRRHFGHTVQHLEQNTRGGRPPIWMIVSSDAALLHKNGSANSISGLHCAMFAAFVWLALLKDPQESIKESK